MRHCFTAQTANDETPPGAVAALCWWLAMLSGISALLVGCSSPRQQQSPFTDAGRALVEDPAGFPRPGHLDIGRQYPEEVLQLVDSAFFHEISSAEGPEAAVREWLSGSCYFMRYTQWVTDVESSRQWRQWWDRTRTAAILKRLATEAPVISVSLLPPHKM